MTNPDVYKVTFDNTDNVVDIRCHTKSQMLCRYITEHLVTRLIIIVLILVDISIIIYLVVKSNEHHYVLDHVSLTVSCIFVVEVTMRVCGLGLVVFFHNWLNVVDLIVVLATFAWSLVSCIIIDMTSANALPAVRLVTRLPRILNIMRIVSNKNNFLNSSRYITSENKRRYRLDGFDLDLCYVTNRVIAMSFPSSGLAALYRNPIMDVAKFLNERHGRRYKVYNLCEERSYNVRPFHGQVERYMIADHNVPRLEEMLRFAKSSRDWLSMDADNVIVVHCKGGKGRTGTMICVHLIDFEIFKTAQLSLEYFGQRRTDLTQGTKFQGVETPSQSRYVAYFEEMKTRLNYELPAPIILVIEKIIVHGITGIGNGDGSDLWLSIHGSNSNTRDIKLLEIFIKEQTQCKTVVTEHESGKASLTITIDNCPPLVNDIKIKVHSLSTKVPKGYDNCAFFFWFNTSFVKDNRLILEREHLDNPHKKSTWKVFREDFGVDVYFAAG